jgi:hypothetical protein
MAEYLVTIPIAGSISITVDADSEDDAKEKANNILDEEDWDKMLIGESSDVSLDELEAYESIVEGNVCHVSCNEIIVERQ